MLRLPEFEVLEPTTVEEVLSLLAQYGDRARLMAGGTDLMPNLKHEVDSAEVVIGLWNVSELRGIEERADGIHILPLTTLDELSNAPLIKSKLPALADAASVVAGPQLRSMGTIGGNVCLDTRCVYINQSHFWRQALGYCLKKDGTVCHVVKGGRRCVAAASNDSAPVLMTLGAELMLRSADGRRRVPVDAYYTTNGAFNQVRERTELLTEIVVPMPKSGTMMGYAKLRTRAAIDFPELGVAVLARLEADGTVAHADICVTALGARPIHVQKLEALYRGRKLDEDLIQQLAEAAGKRAKPLTNIACDPAYRRQMVPIYVEKAFEAARNR